MEFEKMILGRIVPKIEDLGIANYPLIHEFISNFNYSITDLYDDDDNDYRSIYGTIVFAYMIKLDHLRGDIEYIDSENFKNQMEIIKILHMEFAYLFQELSK